MANSLLTLSSEVKYLKGVGPARSELLAARGIHTVEDLLYYTPFRYEDRTRITPRGRARSALKTVSGGEFDWGGTSVKR